MAEPPPVFEAQRHRARCRTIGDRGRRTLERWRIGEAGAALQIAVRDRGRQRNRTARAGRTVEKIERRPAGEAELPNGPDDRTAGGAARRERIINRGAAGRAQDADQILPRGVHRCRPSPPVALPLSPCHLLPKAGGRTKSHTVPRPRPALFPPPPTTPRTPAVPTAPRPQPTHGSAPWER